MRALFTALVLFGAAAAAAAQSHERGLTHDMPTPSIGLPLPHIGLPLPSIGLPLPPMGLPPAQPQRLGRAGRFERPERIEGPERSERIERSERFERPERSERPRSIVFFGWPYLPAEQFPVAPTPLPEVGRAAGRLQLTLSSGVDPQIFVDGYYAGLFSDVAGALTLEAGAHTIELREEGFESLRLPVNIQPDEVVTYDIELTPTVSAPLPSVEPVARPAPTTIYVIPGCYVGNVPPQEVTLPVGCDTRNAIEFPSR
jgi:PEGA domain